MTLLKTALWDECIFNSRGLSWFLERNLQNPYKSRETRPNFTKIEDLRLVVKLGLLVQIMVLIVAWKTEETTTTHINVRKILDESLQRR